MNLKNILAGAAALSLAMLPLAAEAANTAKPVAASKVKRAGSPLKAESKFGEEGGSGTIIAIVAAVAIIAGIVLIAGGDDNPTSP